MSAVQEALGAWLCWSSPLYPVWLWHVLLDGTRACPCERSRRWRRALARLDAEVSTWEWGGGEA